MNIGRKQRNSTASNPHGDTYLSVDVSWMQWSKPDEGNATARRRIMVSDYEATTRHMVQTSLRSVLIPTRAKREQVVLHETSLTSRRWTSQIWDIVAILSLVSGPIGGDKCIFQAIHWKLFGQSERLSPSLTSWAFQRLDKSH